MLLKNILLTGKCRKQTDPVQYYLYEQITYVDKNIYVIKTYANKKITLSPLV